MCIGDGNVKKKPKNVLVILPALCSDAVVLPHLVTFVYTPHVLIVQYYRLRTKYSNPVSVPLPPIGCVCGVRLGQCGQCVNRFSVHPH